MTKAKKIEMKKDIIRRWYVKIIARGYIMLCEDDVEKLSMSICCQTGYPKAKIKKYFWENVYTDREFMQRYQC
jgi:hypothetical protein